MNSKRQNENNTAEVIRTYIKPIFGFALNRVKQRMVAKDLAQEILLQRTIDNHTTPCYARLK